MATDRTAGPQTDGSTLQQTAKALGDMIETGANLVGRGIALVFKAPARLPIAP